MTLTLVGLPDGGITFIFDDHPALHRLEGQVEVSFSHKTLSLAVLAAAEALEKGDAVVLDLPYEEDDVDGDGFPLRV